MKTISNILMLGLMIVTFSCDSQNPKTLKIGLNKMNSLDKDRKKYVLYDQYHTRLTLTQTKLEHGYNWLFLAGGPGADSEYFAELLEILNLPGNVWLVDLPENGSNKLNTHYSPDYNFNEWEKCLKHVLKSLDNAILVGHSFSGIYPLLYPEIEKDLSGLVILNSASRPWIDNALKIAKVKNLPSFEKEMSEFLANKNSDTWEKVRKIFAHYYFTENTFEKGCAILFRKEFNFHAINWWLLKASSINFNEILIPSIPTLIIGSSEDCAVPFKGYLTDERFQKSNILIKEIQGGSHFPWLEKPREIKESFKEYIVNLSKK